MIQKRTLSPSQDLAANPSENVWVQANAGTGKTSVLVQRLLRILFRDDPHNGGGILCLTYTNAGAGEMRNRILAALREWALLSDDDLRELLVGVAVNNPPTDSDMEHARRIFFKYIDNPDILKIKTIHGFCEEILHRFPLEAGISPAWSLVSDAAQRVLLQDTFSALVNSSNNPTVANAFTHIVGRVSETYMDELLEILSDRYKYFFQVKNIDNYRQYFIDTTRNFLKLTFIKNNDFDPLALQNIIDMVQNDINDTKKPANYLTNIINLTQQYIDKTIDFEKYKTAYLTNENRPIANVAKKDYLVAEQQRVYNLVQQSINQTVFDDTIALFELSAAFADKYRELKHARNLLDFEDLILYTRELFSRPDVMGWVLSQLNVRLGHILVDEAQDTNPLQWDILRMLAGDFFTDGDTEQSQHSIFVVGDTKQSIYGFQGADPNAFAASRTDIAAHITENLRTIREIPLAQSFRSLPAILHTVDTFFDNPIVGAATGFKNNTHACFRQDGTGLVELHKLVAKQECGRDTIDYVREIADKIQSLVKTNHCRPSDIMVLVQKRYPFAPTLVTELKRRNIDVAGSDRIVLPEFPAIRDLLNLVRFCLNPADDYSLCCILKSPIFRLTERDIFNICTIKNTANKAQKETTPTTVFDVLHDTHPDIVMRLDEYIKSAAELAPYSFFDYVLNNNKVRKNMIAALGGQIIDPIEEFMTICLAYERTQSGTLHHFLKWFITGGCEIKRDMDAASGVRITTVHGSKGLEAPIVFLIDTTRTPDTEKILPIPGVNASDTPAPWLWTPRASHSACVKNASDELMTTRTAEYYRLLYVAMTRARNELYIYGFTTHKNAPEISWHSMLWRILAGDTNETFIRIEK